MIKDSDGKVRSVDLCADAPVQLSKMYAKDKGMLILLVMQPQASENGPWEWNGREWVRPDWF